MPEQLLHGTDVVARFLQVGRERVTQRMGANFLSDAGRLRRQFDGALQSVLVKVVPTGVVRAWIDGQPPARKDPLPTPVAPCVRKLPVEGFGQVDLATLLWHIDAGTKIARGVHFINGGDTSAPVTAFD